MIRQARNGYPEKRLSILYVDDEETSLKHFKNIFGEKFSVFTASSAREGLDLLEENKDRIGILMTDQRMPEEKGTHVLQKCRERYPHVLRILISAYADLEAMGDAINQGGIYKYVRKPWDIPKLEALLTKGLAFFALREIRKKILMEKEAVLEERAATDLDRNLRSFTSTLSHYLQNPVEKMKEFIDEVSEKGLEEGFRHKALKEAGDWLDLLGPVSAQVGRILFILSRLDEAGKNLKDEKYHQIRIQEVVFDVMGTMEARLKDKKIRIENNIPEDFPPIKATPEMFHRIFELLLEDEISSLVMGGVVRISAKVNAGSGCEPARFQIEIEDDGPGLRGKSFGAVFEPFYIRSQDPKELGLNLWVCSFIIQGLGGQIKARNNQRGGTTFMISLPGVPDRPRSKGEHADFFHKIVWNEAAWEYMFLENFNKQLLECIIEAYNRDQ
ncbi:MAG: response regulator [Nitrospiria bacterium]